MENPLPWKSVEKDGLPPEKGIIIYDEVLKLICPVVYEGGKCYVGSNKEESSLTMTHWLEITPPNIP